MDWLGWRREVTLVDGGPRLRTNAFCALGYVIVRRAELGTSYSNHLTCRTDAFPGLELLP